MKHNAFGDQSEKFLVQSFVILLIFFMSYFMKETTASCLLLLSGIMETPRAINIEGLDLQMFDLSMRQIIWIRYRALMQVASPNRQHVARHFAFTLN